MGLEHDGKLLLGSDERHSRSCISEILKEDDVCAVVHSMMTMNKPFIQRFLIFTFNSSRPMCLKSHKSVLGFTKCLYLCMFSSSITSINLLLLVGMQYFYISKT